MTLRIILDDYQQKLLFDELNQGPRQDDHRYAEFNWLDKLRGKSENNPDIPQDIAKKELQNDSPSGEIVEDISTRQNRKELYKERSNTNQKKTQKKYKKQRWMKEEYVSGQPRLNPVEKREVYLIANGDKAGQVYLPAYTYKNIDEKNIPILTTKREKLRDKYAPRGGKDLETPFTKMQQQMGEKYGDPKLFPRVTEKGVTEKENLLVKKMRRTFPDELGITDKQYYGALNKFYAEKPVYYPASYDEKAPASEYPTLERNKNKTLPAQQPNTAAKEVTTPVSKPTANTAAKEVTTPVPKPTANTAAKEVTTPVSKSTADVVIRPPTTNAGGGTSIKPSTPSSGGGKFPWWAVGAGVAGLGAAGTIAALRRRKKDD